MKPTKCQAKHPQLQLQCWQSGEHDEHPEGQHWAVPPAKAKDVTTIPQPVRW